VNERNEEYWWLVGAAWLFGVVALVIVLNVVRVHLLNRPAAAPTVVSSSPPPSAPVAPSGPPRQSIFSETAEGAGANSSAKTQAIATPPAPVETSAPAAPTTPAPVETPKKLRPVVQMEVKDVTDEQIGKALTRGVNYLLKQFGKTARLSADNVDPDAFQGLNALCIYALLHAGQAINDPRLNIQNEHMRDLLDRLKDYPMDGSKATYSRSLRISALAVYNRPEDRAGIAADANWLMKSSIKGGYTYSMPTAGMTGFDNSNSQYGALGMWAAADSGFPVPGNYWADVEQHWIGCQAPNGGWDYGQGGAGTLSMTAAGVTSLFIARDQQAIESAAGKQAPLSLALTRGLEWLDEGGHAAAGVGGHPGYTRYGLERAGLASGYKYFGEYDWYLTSAREAISSQKEDGSWDGGDGVQAETAFNLLLLARGRQPVFMSKLRLGDGWGMHPRDVANLTKFAAHELERPVNWQTATFDRDWMDWSDAPVLFIASDKMQVLKDSQIEKLRDFAQGGGLIFTHSNANSATFNLFVEELAKKLWPNYAFQDLPADHLAYSVMFPMKTRPALKAVSNGARLLLVHSPTDLARQWVLQVAKTQRSAAEMGINLSVYAGGKRNLRNRVDSLYVREPTGKPIGTIGLAKVKYQGNWDPEPWAWTRMARKFEWETSIHLDVKETAAEDLKFDSQTPLAVMTGTSAFKLGDEQIKAIGQFVNAGGMLFIDDCGGRGEFAGSVREMLSKTFPQQRLDALPEEHEILAAKLMGMDAPGKPRFRLYVTEQPAEKRPDGIQWLAAGNGQVIFSPMDLTSGLLGTSTWGIMGYDPQWAQQFVKNMLLVTAGVEEKPKKPAE